ncbi:MAG TPA: EamA family transporter, partial [Burkholderiaceae bacterium]
MWARLLKRHPAGKVAPFSLLVPVVGLYAAWIVFDERLGLLQWLGVATVALGLLINNFGPRLRARLKAR